MNKRTAMSIATGLSLIVAGPAPASTKPCRSKDGKIIECPKTRKVSPRCKDDKGRFVACSVPATAGGREKPQPSR